MWYRQGRSIVVLPGRNGGGAEVNQELAAGDREVGASYTQCDFIDSRIDVAAQRALFQMLRRDAPSRSASLGLFAAVKAGRLAGLYQEDQQVPALRARRLGIGWWQVIPSGQRAVCLSQPSTEPPIIIFRSRWRPINVLSDARCQAWPSCGLPQLAATTERTAVPAAACAAAAEAASRRREAAFANRSAPASASSRDL